MAKLLVFRGETFIREVELGRQTFRIGRSEQNDLILEDPGKAVSRNHAEIRFENGQYVLADLESQNGIWVSGARVPFVVLEPKTAASVGPYRLTLEVDPPTETDFVLPVDVDPAIDAPTEFSSVARTEPRATESIPRQTPPPPVVAAPPRPTPKPPVSKPTPKPTPKPALKKPGDAPTQNWTLIGGAAVAVIALIAVVFVWMRKPSVPEGPTPQQQVETLLADARTRIERNDCVGALNSAIEPALVIEPNNADALALKTRASACVPAPAPAAPVAVAMTADEIGEHLRVADEAIGRRECDAALADHISKVLEQEPTNPKAVELKAKAEACPPLVVRAPSAPAPAAPKLAVKIPAESGGIEPTSGELDKDYQVRVKAMKTRYDEAVGVLASGAYARAIPALQSIVREAGNRYLDVSSKLTEARKGAAGQAMAEARDAEAKGDYDQAVQALRRAAAADPDPKIEEDLRRIGEKRMQAGLKACDDGKNAYAFNRPQQALQFYQQVVKLLPPDHPCTVTAKERIAALTR